MLFIGIQPRVELISEEIFWAQLTLLVHQRTLCEVVFFSDWTALGLENAPNVGDNDVHASASPSRLLQSVITGWKFPRAVMLSLFECWMLVFQKRRSKNGVLTHRW